MRDTDPGKMWRNVTREVARNLATAVDRVDDPGFVTVLVEAATRHHTLVARRVAEDGWGGTRARDAVRAGPGADIAEHEDDRTGLHAFSTAHVRVQAVRVGYAVTYDRPDLVSPPMAAELLSIPAARWNPRISAFLRRVVHPAAEPPLVMSGALHFDVHRARMGRFPGRPGIEFVTDRSTISMPVLTGGRVWRTS